LIIDLFRPRIGPQSQVM